MAASHKKFKTEVQQLLDLVIHSLYSNRDIFLRELISNASDAIDRARFESLSRQEVLEDSPEWKITVAFDKAARTITVTDNGIGMSLEEVEKNIGTIASSGTRQFLEELRTKEGVAAPELIGQFGVGFYSAFMVADRVTLLTRRPGDKSDGVRWESTGDGTYTIEKAEKAQRGTEITLHLKAELDEYLEEWRLRKIIKRYSDFVEHPIALQLPPDPEKKDEAAREEIVNSRKAIWQRMKSEIKPEEYNEFYRHVSHDFLEPLDVIHWTGEGKTDFKGLLYLPKKAGFDFMVPDMQHRGIHLYVKRVFITDNCEELRPAYLRFLRGVIDSADLPLNISREILQENKLVRTIQSAVVNKVLGTLAEMKQKNRDKYLEFWREFGKVLKEGVHTDLANREKLQDLFLFESAQHAAGKLLSLEEYVLQMPATQKEIYYITGDSRKALENSPHLEAFRKAGFDVLFMTDPIDEWVAQDMTEFKGKTFKCVTKGSVDLPAGTAEEQAKQKELAENLLPLISYLTGRLKGKVKDVAASQRLTDSACCLAFDEHALGSHMERILKAMNRDVPTSKGTLEINPGHPLIATMRELLRRDEKHPKLEEYADLLFDQALLTAGLPVDDLLQFTRRVSNLMTTEAQGLAGQGPAQPAPAAG